MSDSLSLSAPFAPLVHFWAHALAAGLFAALAGWRIRRGLVDLDTRLSAAAFAMTALWAWVAAVEGGGILLHVAETARNFLWVTFLHHLWVRSAGEQDQAPLPARQRHGVRPVYAAVAGVLAAQLLIDILPLLAGRGGTNSAEWAALLATGQILRMTSAAGALVLAHNLYGQAAPSSLGTLRYALLGLVGLWGFDLNFYTLQYFNPDAAQALDPWRGLAAALTAPLFAIDARRAGAAQVRLSRAATFQSISLLAISGYFAVMAILATAMKGTGFAWTRSLGLGVMIALTLGTLMLALNARARGWVKVKLTKHLFEHRYDYRAEWLRFADTLGRAGPAAPPLGERIIKALADIVEAPGGLLYALDDQHAPELAADWHWPAGPIALDALDDARTAGLWHAIGESGRIVELDGLRGGWSDKRDLAVPCPAALFEELRAWIVVPLVHLDRLTGLVVLAAPDYRRPLDWEDFDLLRTAGRQAASSLAEMHGQQALMNAQRFEEFNRRFAFILHDIKNLVSQLSLLSRNAERHADNADFRADMVATLKSSVGKMNDMLQRLSPKDIARSDRIETVALRPMLLGLVAARRAGHPLRLVGDAMVQVRANADGLETALSHLIQNAVDASPPNRAVTVKAEPTATGEVTIHVIDQGQGMDPQFVRHRLFQPFASTKDGGFGVGAYEARCLVTAMGGRLQVDSRPGKGSRFIITLPAAAAITTVPAGAATGAPVAPAPRKSA